MKDQEKIDLAIETLRELKEAHGLFGEPEQRKIGKALPAAGPFIQCHAYEDGTLYVGIEFMSPNQAKRLMAFLDSGGLNQS